MLVERNVKGVPTMSKMTSREMLEVAMQTYEMVEKYGLEECRMTEDEYKKLTDTIESLKTCL